MAGVVTEVRRPVVERQIDEPRAPRDHLRVVVDLGALLLVVGAGVRMLAWRASMLSGVGATGWVFATVEAAAVISLAITGLAIVGRRTRPVTPPGPPPVVSLDVLIPVAREPVSMVRQTILAAKDISVQHTIYVCNDGLMAGSPHWRNIEWLAEELGVQCLTRTGGGPGKAGNLNYALRRSTGSLVLVIDADHLVEADVGERLLGWFRDPDVAFVTTPQRFVNGQSDPLNPHEPVFYEAIQPARDAAGLAFSTGNGVVYRRTAIESIGGFSEWSIVEDLHTSMRLHDAGWQSVYHREPVTTGISPQTAAEYARQRLRWATDSLRILFFDNPLRRRGLSIEGRLRYLQILVMYVLIAMQVGLLLGPAAWILARMSVVPAASDGDHAAYLGPWLLAVAVALLVWGGPRGAVRSLRTNFFLAPVFLIGIVQALGMRVERGGATNKTGEPRFNSTVAIAAVPLLLLLGSLVVAVFDTRPNGSDVAVAWGAALAIVVCGPFLRMGHRVRWAAVAQGSLIVACAAVAIGAVATARLGWEPPSALFQSMTAASADGAIVETNVFGDSVVRGDAVPSPISADEPQDDGAGAGEAADGDGVIIPTPLRLEPATGIYVGVAGESMPYEFDDIDRWTDEIGRPQIVHWYQQWGSGETRFRGDWLARVAEAGAVPMVSWEAWAKPSSGYASAEQELGSMSAIASGVNDPYIRSWAEAAADHGQPILLRPFHEMNGYWYPWSVGVNGNTAADYVAGWRHVHSIFEEAGADNVSWVWSINTLAAFEDGRGVEEYYPGDDVVDWVATSGFNWGTSQTWSDWSSADEVFAETYDVLAGFGKPVMFSEVGTGREGGDVEQWISDGLDAFARYPSLRAVVWFDRGYDGTIDFRLTATDRAVLAAAVQADPVFSPNLNVVPSNEVG